MGMVAFTSMIIASRCLSGMKETLKDLLHDSEKKEKKFARVVQGVQNGIPRWSECHVFHI